MSPTRWIQLALLLGAFAAGWISQGWLKNAALAEQTMRMEITYRDAAEAHSKALTHLQETNQSLQQELATIDATTTQELSNAQQENNRLRRLYHTADADRQRLRIAGKTVTAAECVSSSSDPASVGDAATFELSEAAGSAVWDLRAALITDRAKLEYLQGYVCSLSPTLSSCTTKE